jgi:hypothetical protein
MERTPIESSAILSVGYDLDTHRLEIEFVSGTVYQYVNVPEYIYSELMDADSKGAFFDRHIRNEGFSFIRLL